MNNNYDNKISAWWWIRYGGTGDINDIWITTIAMREYS